MGADFGGVFTAIIGPLTASFATRMKGTLRLSMTGRPALIAAALTVSQSYPSSRAFS